MSARSHFRLGYLVQIISLLTLSATNILLPNLLGATEFTRLNEAYAFVGFSCVVFNEGVAALVIRAIGRIQGDVRAARDLALQAAFEHSLLTLPVLAVLIVVTSILKPDHHYAAADWLIIAVSGVVFGLYVPMVAWLNATLQNRWVAVLAMVQGTLSCLLPIAAFAVGIDVRWAIFSSYLVGLAACVVLLHKVGPIRWRPSFSRARRVCIVPALVAVSASTAMRIAIIWLPVLVLSARGSDVDSAAYKIAMSFGLGICALVPFHRQTMLSLEEHNSAQMTARLAAGAVQIATFGAVLMIVLAEPLVSTLYRVELNAIVSYMHAFGFFVVLQVLADVLLVRLISMRADMTLIGACGTAIAAATIYSHFNYALEWLPALTLAVFVLYVCLRHGGLISDPLVFKSALVGIVCIAAVVFLSDWTGVVAAIAIYLAMIMYQTPLRLAMGQTIAHLVGRSKGV